MAKIFAMFICYRRVYEGPTISVSSIRKRVKQSTRCVLFSCGGAALRHEYPGLALKIKRISLYSGQSAESLSDFLENSRGETEVLSLYGGILVIVMTFLLSLVSIRTLMATTPVGMAKVAIYQPLIGFLQRAI